MCVIGTKKGVIGALSGFTAVNLVNDCVLIVGSFVT